uniref:ANK_REP_REGION domain-containing protein n=1 Tax=Macrostomum lignano TaxID=282301 RepID=A0A1I8G1W6_9PLAT
LAECRIPKKQLTQTGSRRPSAAQMASQSFATGAAAFVKWQLPPEFDAPVPNARRQQLKEEFRNNFGPETAGRRAAENSDKKAEQKPQSKATAKVEGKSSLKVALATQRFPELPGTTAGGSSASSHALARAQQLTKNASPAELSVVRRALRLMPDSQAKGSRDADSAEERRPGGETTAKLLSRTSENNSSDNNTEVHQAAQPRQPGKPLAVHQLARHEAAGVKSSEGNGADASACPSARAAASKPGALPHSPRPDQPEADVPYPTDEQFMRSILEGNLTVVDRYLEARNNLDVELPVLGEQFSPLHLTCSIGRLEVLKRLIEAQADIDLLDSDGCTPLYLAAQNGYYFLADLLIKAQADVNKVEGIRASPLYIASQEGHIGIVQLLIEAQADIDRCINKGVLVSPLHAASFGQHHEVVRALVKAEADANVANLVGISPLYIASQEGHLKVVELLLTAQIDLSSQDAKGCSPLYLASQNGHRRVVQALIAASADVNLSKHNGMSPSYVASQNGHHEVLNVLIKALADFDTQECTGTSPLHIASSRGHHRVVKALVEAQANVNSQDNSGVSCMLAATHRGHSEVVSLLIQSRADVNLRQVDNESPLYVACQIGHFKIAQALVDAKAELNVQQREGATPLFIAAQQGHLKVVNLLIREGAHVDTQTASGATPLFIACANGHDRVADSLIKAQADIDTMSNDGESPLFIASHQGHTKAVDLLIKAPADVDLIGGNWMSALHATAQVNELRVTKQLIRAQANVDIKSADGLTPLHLASYQGSAEVVTELIDAQADVDVTQANGITPLVFAAVQGHERVVKSLMEAGAESSLQQGQEVLLSVRLVEDKQSGQEAANSGAVAVAQQNNLLDEKWMPDSPTSQPQVDSCDLKSDEKAVLQKENELSMLLHRRLSQSGFTESRAKAQAAVADVLQDILRRRLRDNEVFVVGSYSESWGNNLSALDGTTDIESDIDVMRLISGRDYHIRGVCRCDLVEDEQVEYTNGHIFCPGFASNPAEPLLGSVLKPAVDLVDARRVCCYPPIAPLLPDRVVDSEVPESLLLSLEQALASTHCHVVHAAPQNQAGRQLRVSTTFLEKLLLRSLNTVQGQLFIILKYLVKKVISSKDSYNIQGLKAYHVKTTTFRMLETTPRERWRPENLISLTKKSLKILRDSVEKNAGHNNGEGKILDHFFLCDTALYLKGVEPKAAEEMKAFLETIARALTHLTENFDELVIQFMSTLRSINDGDMFYFHPFVVLPYMHAQNPSPKSNKIEYHEIYDVVREALMFLSDYDCSSKSHLGLLDLIGKLPDCARTARESLRVLACLKFGLQDAAADILIGCRLHKVRRGFSWPTEKPVSSSATELVWQHLCNSDSAWKFCFTLHQRPTYSFISRRMSECVIFQLENYYTNFSVNFDALLQCLRIELKVGIEEAHGWIRDVAVRADADAQELVTAALYCHDVELKRRLKERIQKVIDRTAVLRGWLLDAVRDWYGRPCSIDSIAAGSPSSEKETGSSNTS